MLSFQLRLPGMIAAGILAATANSLPADIIVLKSGGVVRGEFLNDKFTPSIADIQIRTLSGAEITVERSEVASVTRRPMIHEEYELRRKKTPDTLDGQWELAEWCASHNLREYRQTHLRRVVYFDSDHAEARRLLGFKLVNGQWMTQDGIMADRGFVKYKGQYVRPEKLDELVQKQKESDVEKAWYPRIRQWSAWAENLRSNRGNEGLTKLQAIRDANAIPALQRTFAGDNREDARRLYVAVLSEIHDDRSVRALVNQSLNDESLDVRQAARDAIVKLGAERAIPLYLQALQSDSSVVAIRAVNALGDITPKEQFDKVVPRLIAALVIVRHEKVQVVDSVLGMAVHHPYFPGGLGDTIGKVQAKILLGEYPDGAQIQVLFPPGLGPRMKTISVPREYPNYNVLAALKKLSGKDLPLEVSAWRNWWNAETARHGDRQPAVK